MGGGGSGAVLVAANVAALTALQRRSRRPNASVSSCRSCAFSAFNTSASASCAALGGSSGNSTPVGVLKDGVTGVVAAVGVWAAGRAAGSCSAIGTSGVRPSCNRFKRIEKSMKSPGLINPSPSRSMAFIVSATCSSVAMPQPLSLAKPRRSSLSMYPLAV